MISWCTKFLQISIYASSLQTILSALRCVILHCLPVHKIWWHRFNQCLREVSLTGSSIHLFFFSLSLSLQGLTETWEDKRWHTPSGMHTSKMKNPCLGNIPIYDVKPGYNANRVNCLDSTLLHILINSIYCLTAYNAKDS